MPVLTFLQQRLLLPVAKALPTGTSKKKSSASPWVMGRVERRLLINKGQQKKTDDHWEPGVCFINV